MSIYADPESVGISSARLDRAYAYLQDAVAEGRLPAASLAVARHGHLIEPRAFGRIRLEAGSPPAGPDTIFLVASVTKSVTVASVMLLVERGMLSLQDRVCDIVPEFARNGKEEVRVVHLMTHTSGLPDMLPEDRELRRRHAPLEEFVEHIHDLPLDFAPGARIQYQSMGIAMLGEIVARVTGTKLPAFMRREILEPLGMTDTSLGAELDKEPRIAHVDIPEEMKGADWGWNTSYWWTFGAPWGGMFSTVSDILRFCLSFMGDAGAQASPVFSPATIQAMTRDQTSSMVEIPASTRSSQAWGLGWRKFLGHDWSYWGDLLTPGAFGHGGATGTVVWVDPARELACAISTTTPSERSVGLLGRCSNLVAAAVE